jgi:hypothetical protein
MKVKCYTDFDLKQDEAIDEVSKRDDLIIWLSEVPDDAIISIDYATRARLVAYWTEER